MFEVKAKHVLMIECPGCRDTSEYDVICGYRGSSLIEWQENFETRHAPCLEKQQKELEEKKLRAVSA